MIFPPRILLLFLLCASAALREPPSAFAAPRIIYKGPFLLDTTIPGEQKADRLQPSHPYCWQVAADRWMWVFQTRGFSGIDAEHSILYQLRSGKPDGPLVVEGLLARFRDDWDPLEDGSRHWKIHGHPKVFGVPKGALDSNDKVFPHHNRFVAAWYTRARAVSGDRVLDPHSDEKLDATQHLEWVHFSLNNDESDITILTEPSRLRQKGYETGPTICESGENIQIMNHWARPPIALDNTNTRWLDTPHFQRNGVAAIEYRFNSGTDRYEWVRTGPIVKSKPGEGRFMEGAINRVGDEWILSIRARGHKYSPKSWGECSAWVRTRDPFTSLENPVHAPTPSAYCPRTTYLMPDGVLRIFSGDSAISLHRQKRNPLFCWDVNPDDYSVSNIQPIFDAKVELGFEHPMVGFAKLSPVHNNRQVLTFRVTTLNQLTATEKYPAVTDEEISKCGAYHCEILYDEDVPEPWTFSE